MTQPGDEFEVFLRTRTLLPNGMSDDDDKLEPPKALDAIVLKEAREAIRARQLNRTPRWATPVALAATILLCLSIVLNISLNTNRPVANLQRMAAATAEQRASGLVAQAPAPSAAPRPDSSAADRADALAKSSGTRMQALRKTAAPTRSAATDPQIKAPTTAVSARPERNCACTDGAPQLADRASTAARAQSETQSAASTATATDSITALAARGTAGNGAARVSPSTARDPVPAAPAPATPPHPQNPKIWLQQIADLRAEGKTEQADAEMQRFRAAFPGYSAKPAPAAPSEPPQ